MSQTTEVLYPGENYSAEDRKITVIGREVRFMRTQKESGDAHVAIVGLLGSNLMNLTRAQMERQRRCMKDTLWRARNKLIGIGLEAAAIVVYVPFKLTQNRDGIVVLYALETAAPRVAPYMWDHQPRIQAAVTPEIEASLNMVYDAAAREEDEKHEGEDLIECEVEVTIWDDKHNKKKLSSFSDMKLSPVVGKNGIKEVAAELTLLKAALKAVDLPKKFLFGSIQKVEIGLKGEAALELEHEAGKVMFEKFQAKLKASLVLELGIPGTKLKLPIEIAPYLDQVGKPGVEFKVKILDF
ncbi:MAG TPA: hypothetical protein VJ890_00770 [Vineibacter sp.]|nr:hypothetical protein [Vineibacter sp.]